ncbi:MAG: hypothetical protein Ta2D_13180 [Rickettsiales bacterium]|nr:MAG: hypothetical protein Ta2D_13180 [Rickettsiales bacterium]
MQTHIILQSLCFALQKFYSKDYKKSKKIGRRGTERASVFRIAHYLANIIENNEIFEGLNIDNEYSKSEIDKDKKVIYTTGEEGRAIPDLIIHKRGKKNTKYNLLYCEFKINDEENNDIEKLKFFTFDENYKYNLGIFISIKDVIKDIKNNICPLNSCLFFKNGKELAKDKIYMLQDNLEIIV